MSEVVGERKGLNPEMQSLKWVIEIAVTENWVEEFAELPKEVLEQMLSRTIGEEVLPRAYYRDEFIVTLVKKPSHAAVERLTKIWDKKMEEIPF